MKSENLYGKTFGMISYNSSKGDYPKGMDQDSKTKYKSSASDQFVNQAHVFHQTAASIVGVNKLPERYKKVHFQI